MLPISNDPKKEKIKDTLLGLHWAAITGNVGLVKFALDHGVPIDSVVNGFVPLQLACISDNNIAVVQYLIDRGADVNMQKWSKKHSIDKTQAVQGATGSTALHVACANGCIKIVDLLLRNHVIIDIKDKYGSTPLDVAQAKHETEIINLLKVAKIIQEKTHKRPYSDKQKRRPSLPSIFEGRQQPSFTMTPFELPKRSFVGVHRPSMDENSVTPSLLSIPSSHSSDDYSRINLSASPSVSVSTTTDGSEGNPDWYGYGVVNVYDDENYLLSLERRAYNLGLNENGDLERHSQDMTRRSHDYLTTYPLRTTTLKNADSTVSSLNESDDDDDDELYTTLDDYPIPYGMDQSNEMKKGWFSGFGKDVRRHSLDSIHRKGHDLRPNFDHFVGKKTDDHKTGFLSRWTPAWSKK